MKRAAMFLLLAVPVLASDASEIKEHYVAASMDVYVASSVEVAPEIPGATDRNYLTVSVKSTDDAAAGIMVYVMVRLADKTRMARTAILPNNPLGPTVFRFPLSCRPTEVVSVEASGLHAAPGNQLARAY